MRNPSKLLLVMVAGLLVVTIACGGADDDVELTEGTETPVYGEEMDTEEMAEESRDAAELISDASAVLQEMSMNAQAQQMLQRAEGVLIIPGFGRGAVIVGARGGEGVLLARGSAGWNGPAFYDVGAISIGAQLGAEGGDVVALLMSTEAMDQFREDTEFSLNAGAGLTVVDYSTMTEEAVGGTDQDVVLWSDTEGLFAGAALELTGVSWDDEENQAYYGQIVSPDAVLQGQVSAGPGASQLTSALPS